MNFSIHISSRFFTLNTEWSQNYVIFKFLKLLVHCESKAHCVLEYNQLLYVSHVLLKTCILHECRVLLCYFIYGHAFNFYMYLWIIQYSCSLSVVTYQLLRYVLKSVMKITFEPIVKFWLYNFELSLLGTKM